MKSVLLFFFSAIVLLLLTSFTSFGQLDSTVVDPVVVKDGTPFPITGKVTVYGAKGGHKQAVGEIKYVAAIEVKETERETYSVVTVRLDNLCKHDVSGYV